MISFYLSQQTTHDKLTKQGFEFTFQKESHFISLVTEKVA